MKNRQTITSNNIYKSFSPDDRYVNNPENRRKGIVGQPYKHRYKIVTDKKTGEIRLGREKVQEGQLKVGGEGVVSQTHAEDTKKETIKINLSPEMKGKYNLLFNSLKDIRPHGVYWKESEVGKNQEHWEYLMPVPGETKGNVGRVLKVIEFLDQSKEKYQRDLGLEKFGGSSPAIFLAKKYLPKIEKVLSEMKELKDYMSNLDQKLDELESKNLKYQKVVGQDLLESQKKLREEELGKLSEEEREAGAKGYKDKPKSWRTTTRSSYNATWTGD